MDTEILYALLITGAMVAFALISGASVWAAIRNPAMVKTLEKQFTQATEERKEFIRMLDNAFGLAERLAKDVAPVKVREGVTAVAGLLDEITDGVPFDSKTPVVPPATVTTTTTVTEQIGGAGDIVPTLEGIK